MRPYAGGATIASRRWRCRPSADGLERDPCATNFCHRQGGSHGMAFMPWAFPLSVRSQPHGTKIVPWLPASLRSGRFEAGDAWAACSGDVPIAAIQSSANSAVRDRHYSAPSARTRWRISAARMRSMRSSRRDASLSTRRAPAKSFET